MFARPLLSGHASLHTGLAAAQRSLNGEDFTAEPVGGELVELPALHQGAHGVEKRSKLITRGDDIPPVDGGGGHIDFAEQAVLLPTIQWESLNEWGHGAEGLRRRVHHD